MKSHYTIITEQKTICFELNEKRNKHGTTEMIKLDILLKLVPIGNF